MNAVGKFGEFVIEYQDGLEAGLLAVLGIIILIWIIRLIARSSKRTDVLDEMNDKITRIDSEVKDISSKQEELLKGAAQPNKTSGETETEAGTKSAEADTVEPASVANTAAAVEMSAPETASGETFGDIALGDGNEVSSAQGISAAQDVSSADEMSSAQDAADDKSETECPAKYTSRDCGTDKHGKIYTVEILNEKIR
ncbi:MAG: hypothetical protein ACOYJO_04435 [Eubacterium sp.]|jgi:uncharacterized membrane-anchored protein YhcB (DUF1043 family)